MTHNGPVARRTRGIIVETPEASQKQIDTVG